MTRNRIRQLIQILPDTARYQRRFTQHVQMRVSAVEDRAQRYAICLNDPSFGWNLVQSFLDCDQDLPADITEIYLMKAYGAYSYDLDDDVVAQALMLQHPSQRRQRAFVKSLLVVQDMTIAQAANLAGLPQPVMECYNQLFWNVKDRLKDDSYIASLIYPEGRVVEWNDTSLQREGLEMMALRAAYNYGLDELLYVLGHRDVVAIGDPMLTAAELERHTYHNALHVLRAGGANARKHPGIENARMMLAASKMSGQQSANEDDAMGLGALAHGHGNAILSTIHELNQGTSIRMKLLAETQDAFLRQQDEKLAHEKRTEKPKGKGK